MSETSRCQVTKCWVADLVSVRQMRGRIYSLILTVGLVSLSHHDSPAAQRQSFAAVAQIRTIEGILPSGWKIVERRAAAVPTGLVNRETGYYLKLQGGEKLYGKELVNGVPNRYYRGLEHIELWIMPPDFRPKKPNFFQKGWPLAVIADYTATEASNPDFKLFADYTDTPSWPTWGKDIYRALKVVPKDYPKLFVQ